MSKEYNDVKEHNDVKGIIHFKGAQWFHGINNFYGLQWGGRAQWIKGTLSKRHKKGHNDVKNALWFHTDIMMSKGAKLCQRDTRILFKAGLFSKTKWHCIR